MLAWANACCKLAAFSMVGKLAAFSRMPPAGVMKSCWGANAVVAALACWKSCVVGCWVVCRANVFPAWGALAVACLASRPFRLMLTAAAASRAKVCCCVVVTGCPDEVASVCCCCCWSWCSLMTAPFMKSCVVPLFSRAAVSPWAAALVMSKLLLGLLVAVDTTLAGNLLATEDAAAACVGTRFGIWTRFGMTAVVCGCGWNWNMVEPSLVGVRGGLLIWGCC